MPSAAGPLLMCAGDCFEFSFLFVFPCTDQLSVTACGSGHGDRMSGRQDTAEGRGSSTSVELTPWRSELGLGGPRQQQ